MLQVPLLLLSCAPAAELELLDHAGLSAAMHALADAHPEVVSLVPYGTSREGRALEALRLSGADADGKPAVLLVANLDGPDVFDSAVALDHARRLAEGHGADDAVTAFLDATTVLVVPRANPDVAEARFTTPRLERETGGRGVDDDRDGRSGEDAPADVDGDGLVTTMRVPDPEGRWIPDPTDGRAMVEADRTKGERGRYAVHVEGRDADGDERVAEDAPRDTRLNRSFPSGWEEHAPDAGLFPGDEPEARALMELVLRHDELALVMCYGAPDNLAGKPETVKDDVPPRMRVPPPGILESDAELLAEIGERYRDATGNAAERGGDDAGTFQRWCYDHRGLLVLGTVLWEVPLDAKEDAEGGGEPSEAGEPDGDADGASEDRAADAAEGAGATTSPDEDGDEDGSAGEAGAATEEPAGAPADSGDLPKEKDGDAPKPSDDAKRLAWIDAAGDDWRFVDWTPFEHPELGPVEIGGFAPFALREPPADTGDEIAAKHFDFLLTLGALLPRIRLAECTAREVGAGLWRVTAVLENGALLPLQSTSARRARTIRPAKLRLVLPDGARVLAGPEHVLVSELAGSGGRHETTWLVRTDDPTAVVVVADTDNAGAARAHAEVMP